MNYSESETFSLEINDKIFVYENPNYYHGFSYSINGEVVKPGVYPLREGLTISDAISIAGGISEIGSINSISVEKTLIRFNEDGDETSESELVGNISLDFEISDGNIITIFPKTNVIRVEGNVYNPGLVSVDKGRPISMSNAIELAGGYKPYSLKEAPMLSELMARLNKPIYFEVEQREFTLEIQSLSPLILIQKNLI